MTCRPRQIKTAAPAQAIKPKLTGKISDGVLAAASRPRRAPFVNPFTIAQHPPNVIPSGSGMAMDEFDGTNWAAVAAINGAFAEGQAFLGYPLLAELAQRPEYRRISETIATEMTRKWIKLQSTGEDDKTAKIAKIETAMKRLGVQDVFRKVAEQDGFFGRAHLYLDTGATDDPKELTTDIGDGRNEASKNKIKRDGLLALKPIEAVWCYPSNYNSNDPLRPDWYKPAQWYVMGKQVHASRLLTFVGREVPDMLKPAYSFGGLSLSQMARPYVDNWLKTRQSVSDIIKAFSVFVLSTDLADKLGMGDEEIFKRLSLFNKHRDNAGVMAIDKEMELFQNVAAPLGTLNLLQAQAQEHICSVTGIPLVKYTGISPSGLNGSSEEEMDCFETWINAYQELLFTKNLTKVLGFIQLSEFGSIDPEITFEYEPLQPLDEVEQANVRKTEADTGTILIASGAITAEEERERVAADPDSPYASLDKKPAVRLDADMADIGTKVTAALMQVSEAGKISDATVLRELKKASKATGIFTTITDEDIADADQEPPEPMDEMGGMGEPGMGGPGEEGDMGGPGEEGPNYFAGDAAWNESNHKRGQPKNKGQFGSGGGGGAAGKQQGGETSAPAQSGGKAQLKSTEIAAISEYTNRAYLGINLFLRGKLRGKPTGEFDGEIRDITNAINNSQLPEATILYREPGPNFYKKLMELKPGRKFVDKGFISTSKEPRGAMASTRSMSELASAIKNKDKPKLIIHAPAGTHALDVSKATGSKDAVEKEIILQRGTTFQIKSIDEHSAVLEVVR